MNQRQYSIANRAAFSQREIGLNETSPVCIRKVMQFSIAMNGQYKKKAAETAIKIVRYVKCSFWRNAVLAEHLTKERLVSLNGRIGTEAWKTAESEAV